MTDWEVSVGDSKISWPNMQDGIKNNSIKLKACNCSTLTESRKPVVPYSITLPENTCKLYYFDVLKICIEYYDQNNSNYKNNKCISHLRNSIK